MVISRYQSNKIGIYCLFFPWVNTREGEIGFSHMRDVRHFTVDTLNTITYPIVPNYRTDFFYLMAIGIIHRWCLKKGRHQSFSFFRDDIPQVIGMKGPQLTHLSRLYASIHMFGFLTLVNSINPAAVTALDAEHVIKKMEAAYAEVMDYEMKVEVRTWESGDSFKTEHLLYTFKRPRRIRIAYESPHEGMILVYLHKNGKVLVRPWKRMPFFQFHLDTDSSFLKSPSGQRIDQTDLGLLIRNITASMREKRRGDLLIRKKSGKIHINVLAENHFREDALTRYEFVIDTELWLPVAIQESSSSGVLERSIAFQHVRVNSGVPDRLFE